MPPTYSIPTYMAPPQISVSRPPVIEAQPTIITAPPQVAAPSQLAAAVKANREAEAAAKLASTDDAFDVDDDVTRALLAAAAGVTYNHSTTSNASSSTTTSSVAAANSESASTLAASTAPKVVPTVPAKTVIVPQSLLPTQIASSSRLSAVDPPKTRSKSSYTEEPYSFQKKVYKRIAAGMVWEDPTLADWDPSKWFSIS